MSFRELSLRWDALLDEIEGSPGSRDYLCITDGFKQMRDANPPELAPHLQWETVPLPADLDVVGDIELQLDATLSASDGGWIVTLLDVAPDGTAQTITAGWLRASLRMVNEARAGPVRRCSTAASPSRCRPNELVSYRIPIVPNAHRFLPGHRIGLVITGDDQNPGAPTLMGFRHTPVEPAVRASIRSSSRLLLPVLP